MPEEIVAIIVVPTLTFGAVIVVCIGMITRAISKRGASRKELQEIKRDISSIKNSIDDIREQIADIIIKSS
jgi:sensor domain CHASE-containing protein